MCCVPTNPFVYEESLYDRRERKSVTRRLTISGSDRYGLPTAKDDEVLLACIQISKRLGFQSREVQFSRYELLKLLGLSDDSKNYERIELSLRRWKGVTIFSDRAFYDHGAKSWVNRDFGVFDNLYIYRRENGAADKTRCRSRFVWNEVFFDSFRAGYLKRLDWQFYCSLKSPIAKRLYRFLDKRFYLARSFSIGLRELAVNRLGLSGKHNTAQLKRLLLNGTQELEQRWTLTAASNSRRFTKIGSGNWQVHFSQRTPSATSRVNQPQPSESNQATSLLNQLFQRGISKSTAKELIRSATVETIQEMIRLFDWYNSRNQPRGPGFLIESIRNSERIELPKEFAYHQPRRATQAPQKSRNDSKRLFPDTSDHKADQKYKHRYKAFKRFWSGLAPEEQQRFEQASMASCPGDLKEGLKRAENLHPTILKHYRTKLLMDYFESTQGRKRNGKHD